MFSGKKSHEFEDFCVSENDLWVIFHIIKKNTLVITLCTHVHTHIPIHIAYYMQTAFVSLYLTHIYSSLDNHIYIYSYIFIVIYPSMVFTYCRIHTQVKTATDSILCNFSLIWDMDSVLRALHFCWHWGVHLWKYLLGHRQADLFICFLLKYTKRLY